jgi:environmental stress-induced protein Ves
VAVVHLPAADRRATPWKNGGGVTYEIAAFPPEAGLDAFDWRISMATVAQAGSFSTFEGVDRILTVIAGSLSLQFPAAKAVVLDEASDPFTVDGEASCWGAPLGGAAIDLNVMTRRGRVAASVRRANGPTGLTGAAAVLCVVSLDATVLDGAPLKALDAVLANDGELLRFCSPARFVVIDLDCASS